MSAVPLQKYGEFRKLCREVASWYKTHPDWAEYTDETEIQLDRSGDLCAVRGSLLYRLEQRCRRWRVARLDSETDPSTIDTEDLKLAWQERGELVVEVIGGSQCITIAMREAAEQEAEREENEAALRKVRVDAARI